MTGLYVRVGAENVEVDAMDDEALQKWVQSLDEAALRRWLPAVIRWIRDKPDVLVRRAAKVHSYLNRVETGIRALPDRASAEAKHLLLGVLAEAMTFADSDDRAWAGRASL